MTVETFFANFGHLADAPNGVKTLRELILQLAVQGKLVAQDEKDEPAIKLFERRQRVQAKKYPSITDTQEQFVLPLGWEWVRLGDLGQWATGSGFPKTIQGHGDKPILFCKVSDMNLPGNERFVNKTNNTIDDAMAEKGKIKIHPPGAVVFPKIGGAIATNKRRVLVKPTAIDNNCLGILPNGLCGTDWLFLLLTSMDLTQYQSGTSMPSLSQGTLGMIVTGVPPLKEQKRIVARVDQLMALCDELEDRQQKQQQGRVRLNNAALDALFTARESDEFVDHWQRISTNFDLLYDHPETIAKLRAAILQLAVQGKLVPQKPNDEPASVLLERIMGEKEKLVKGKLIRKEKPLVQIDENFTPFMLPATWKWVRLGYLCRSVEYGTSQKAHAHSSGVPVLRMGNIFGGKVHHHNLKYVSAEIKDLPKLYLKKGEILFNRTNSYELVGKAGVFEGEDDSFTFASYLIRASLFQKDAIPKFVNYAFNADYFRKTQIEPELTQQCGQANFNGTKLKNTLVPVPPVAEQKRIVAKVDQLMALCDELETKLNQAQKQSAQLMEATVLQFIGKAVM